MVDLRGGERRRNGHDIVALMGIHIYVRTYIHPYIRLLFDVVREIVASWGGGRRREEPPPLSARGGIGRAGGRGAPSAANGVLVSAFQGFCPPKSGVSCARRTRAREPVLGVHETPTFPTPYTRTYIKAAAHRSPGFTIAADGRMSSYFVYSTPCQPHGDLVALHPVRPSPFFANISSGSISDSRHNDPAFSLFSGISRELEGLMMWW